MYNMAVMCKKQLSVKLKDKFISYEQEYIASAPTCFQASGAWV